MHTYRLCAVSELHLDTSRIWEASKETDNVV